MLRDVAECFGSGDVVFGVVFCDVAVWLDMGMF